MRCHLRGISLLRRGAILADIFLWVVSASVLVTSVAAASRCTLRSYHEGLQCREVADAAHRALDQITGDIAASDRAASVTIGSGAPGVELVKTHPDARDPSAAADNPIFITYWFDSATQ